LLLGLYALPKTAVKSLARPFNETVRSLFNPGLAEAEEAFSTLCIRHDAVGFRANSPIKYSLFQVKSVSIIPASIPWSSQCPPATVKFFNDVLKNARTKQKAFVGRLWCSARFRKELESIKAAFARCPGFDRIDFPLRRLFPAAVKTRGGDKEASVTVNNYRDLARLLDRWSLAELTTWDLPYPQGPLDWNPFPRDSPALPAAGVRAYVPTYFPVDAKRLRGAIEAQQLTEARRMGLPVELAAMGEVKSYAAVADLVHLERTIRSRCPGQKRGGIVSHIESAAMAHLKLRIDRIRSLRKLIARSIKESVESDGVAGNRHFTGSKPTP
jgi:hypothetical protein